MTAGARSRLTGAGLACCGFAGATAAVGVLGGNNLVLLVVAVLLALGPVEWVLGSLNLVGLQVVRRLPAELFAEQEAHGAWVVRNRAPRVTARAVSLTEVGGERSGWIDQLAPGAERPIRTGWRFDRRGPARLEGVRLTSTFPFGWVRRERVVALPAEVLVYPAVLAGGRERTADARGEELRTGAEVGAFGDFAGLRGYHPGDRLTTIHWPTSARAGAPVVVVRAGSAGEELVVRVPDRSGIAWEDALSRACGAVQRGFQRGCAVGLELLDTRLDAHVGDTWRRRLLDALATAPRRDDP